LFHYLACHFIFFFNHTPNTLIYTLSLHDALPIFINRRSVLENSMKRLRWLKLVLVLLALTTVAQAKRPITFEDLMKLQRISDPQDRKSTRLNSSHRTISYAVFCLKKKKKKKHTPN